MAQRHAAMWYLDRSIYERFVKVIDGNVLSIFQQLDQNGYVLIDNYGLGPYYE